MPTYEYETIVQGGSEEPVRFEVWQHLSEEPLTEHPETGQPVRRLISGGLAILSKGDESSGGCCSSGGCGCG